MKKIFVSHPYQGKKQNKAAIQHTCRALVKLGVIPISPVHAFGYLDDNVKTERLKALDFCCELVEISDELWLFGDWEHSHGCNKEHNVALMELIPVYEVIGWFRGVPVFKGDGPMWMREEK